jgi:hypothetical protein
MLSKNPEGGLVMKTISIFLALINALMAGLILALSLSSIQDSQAAWWSFTRITASLCVILIAAITWMASARAVSPALMSVCSLMLVVVGAATTVWTFHRALISGDMEYYMIVYGGSLIVQGMSSLFGFGDEPRAINSL